MPPPDEERRAYKASTRLRRARPLRKPEGDPRLPRSSSVGECEVTERASSRSFEASQSCCTWKGVSATVEGALASATTSTVPLGLSTGPAAGVQVRRASLSASLASRSSWSMMSTAASRLDLGDADSLLAPLLRKSTNRWPIRARTRFFRVCLAGVGGSIEDSLVQLMASSIASSASSLESQSCCTIWGERSSASCSSSIVLTKMDTPSIQKWM